MRKSVFPFGAKLHMTSITLCSKACARERYLRIHLCAVADSQKHGDPRRHGFHIASIKNGVTVNVFSVNVNDVRVPNTTLAIVGMKKKHERILRTAPSTLSNWNHDFVPANMFTSMEGISEINL